MKRSYLLIILTALSFITGCRKDDNPKVPTLERVPVPLILKDQTKDLSISAQDPLSFDATFTVDTYFKSDAPPKKFDLKVMKNSDESNVITLQSDITSFPVTVNITGQQLIDLFGEPIVLGDRFEFGTDITTQDGKVYPAFNPLGVAYGSGVNNQAGASVSVRYEAICLFNAADYDGDFEVVSDEWADYDPGDIVPVRMIDDTHLAFQYAADNPKDIIIEVNPASNETSVAPVIYGDYGSFTDLTATSIEGSVDNYVGPCEGILSVRLNHSSAAGNFGDATIVLKKVN